MINLENIFNQRKINEVIEFVCNLDEKPEWVEKEQIELEWHRDILTVIFNETYKVQFDFSDDGNYTTTFSIEGTSGLNPYDLQYMIDVMESKQEIFDIINK